MAAVSFRMIVDVLAWGTVVAAGGFVVAAADGGMKDVAVVIDVEGETAGAFATIGMRSPVKPGMMVILIYLLILRCISR